ncbi:olfactory receptor 142-like [Hypomesus transpacificus]|uniref:olfactory receptor 142-like n=1 Tax=Hypomesus transpacificus TaxID=137520 RepID=UPI001F07E441|nr:olfactory receptor 142-like [Hypomesus transpacificus]
MTDIMFKKKSVLIMENSSDVTSIVLTAYYGMEKLKHAYFCIFLIIYIIIITENLILISVIGVEKMLHEPMYFFIGNLAANGVYGSTVLLPALLSNLLSTKYEVLLACCQTQIYGIHTYGMIEFTVLAVMSYDRYAAICHPLHYHTIMSLSKVYKLIVFTWVYPLIAILIFFIVTLQLRFCQQAIDKLYCTNDSLVKLSCSNTAVFSYVGLASFIPYAFPQLIMVLFSYAQIFRLCLSSREMKTKAITTCIPHLFAFSMYSIGCLFELLQSRLDLRHLPYETRLFMSLFFLIFPPFFNPLIYGLSIRSLRLSVFKCIKGHRKTLPTQ